LQSRVKEKDIMDIVELLKTDSTITTAEERQKLIDEVHKYGGIKSIIKKLAQQVDELRNEVESLETQKQNPNTDNQKMFSRLVYPKRSLDFFDVVA
jgi:type I site-specific restriction endonuclease